MRERTICCSSLSKTYSITGWRLGYTMAPVEISDHIRKVHDFLTVGAAAPLQETIITALHFPDSYYEALQNEYTRKKNLFLSGLDNLGLKHNDPEGAYYVLMDISEFGYDNDSDFAYDMSKKVGVAAVPGSSFFREDENRYVRFHFAKKDETLIKALDRMSSIKRLLAK